MIHPRIIVGAWGLAVLGVILAACHGGSSPSPPSVPPPSPTVTIVDVRAYLAQTVCQDAAGATIALSPFDPACNARPLRASDPLYFRWHDLPAPGGQVRDRFVADSGAYYADTFVYPPWGAFSANPANDGGEVFVVSPDNSTVTIAATQDGGKPYLQYFTGPKCGGVGWLLFRNDAPTGSWASASGLVGDSADPNSCTGLGMGYARYRAENLPLPITVAGVARTMTLPAIVSEAYGGASPAFAGTMERFALLRGAGIIWEHWTRSPATDPTLPQRCPFSTAFTGPATPPAAGWYLDDCRDVVDLEPSGGTMSAALYGWPGAGFAP